MEITKEMIIDILENLNDDELRLFIEHLVNSNEFAKESLYKYYIGLLNQKYIDKKNYKERITNEIKVDKIHPYAFVSFYELMHNSLLKYNKNNDDFLYELIYEAYIQLSLKYSKYDFLDLLDYLNEIDTPLSNNTLEIIITKINLLKSNKLDLKLSILTNLLKYINKDTLPIYLDAFYSLYELNDNKEIYLPLIDYIFIYIQKNYSKYKAIHFLEYFVIENYRINHTVVSFYQKEEDYDKAISILNKINAANLKENEYKDYLITKGKIYKKLGSNKLYFKSLIDLILHNHFEYFNVLKDEQKERDFLASLTFIIDNLTINKNANIELLHSIFKDNISIQGLIKFFNYFPLDIIYDDILYFKEIDLNKASILYEVFIIHLSQNIENRALLNSLNEHIIEYKRNYLPLDFNKFLNIIKSNLKPLDYKYIYSNLLNEFKTN